MDKDGVPSQAPVDFVSMQQNAGEIKRPRRRNEKKRRFGGFPKVTRSSEVLSGTGWCWVEVDRKPAPAAGS